MQFHIRAYAKSDSGRVVLHNYARSYDRLDKLRDKMVRLYEQLCYRSGVEFTDQLREEAKTHAYALWIACDKMQIIHRVRGTAYVLECSVISGEHDKKS